MFISQIVMGGKTIATLMIEEGIFWQINIALKTYLIAGK